MKEDNQRHKDQENQPRREGKGIPRVIVTRDPRMSMNPRRRLEKTGVFVVQHSQDSTATVTILPR